MTSSSASRIYRHNSLLLAAAWAAALSLTRAAPAEVRTFPNDRGGFTDGLGASRTYGFETAEGFRAATGLSPVAFPDGRVTVGSDFPQLGQVWVESYGGSQVLGTRPLFEFGGKQEPTLVLTFQEQPTAVGLDLLGVRAGGTEYLQADFGDDQPQSFTLGNADGDPATPEFWGILADRPIHSLSVNVAPNAGWASPNGQDIRVDNLIVGSVLPEPSFALSLPLSAWALLRRGSRR